MLVPGFDRGFGCGSGCLPWFGLYLEMGGCGNAEVLT